jgi:hypothetical protein
MSWSIWHHKPKATCFSHLINILIKPVIQTIKIKKAEGGT